MAPRVVVNSSPVTGGSGGTAEAAFWAGWDEFAASLRRARGRAVHDGQHGLTLSQFRLLSAVVQAGSALGVDLAEQVGISQPTVARMLGALEANGLVARYRTEQDRRRVWVQATEAGRQALAAKARWVAAKRRAFYDSLSPAERRNAQLLFRRFTEVLEVL